MEALNLIIFGTFIGYTSGFKSFIIIIIILMLFLVFDQF